MRILFLSFVFISSSAFCQKFSLLFSAQVSFPTDNFRQTAGNGAGISGRFEYKISKRFSGIFSIDGLSFAEKSVTIQTVPVLLVRSKAGTETLQLGGKFNLWNGLLSTLYVTGELGYSGFHYTLTSDLNKVSTYDNNFCYRYAIGYSIKKWDVSYSQQFISDGTNSINYLSFRLGYLINMPTNFFHRK